MSKAGKMFFTCPVVFDWVAFKGDIYFAGLNYQASEKAGKPMMDMYYCATQACNHNVLFTTQFDKNKFKPCHLSDNW